MEATVETFVTLKMSGKDAELLQRFLGANGLKSREAWSSGSYFHSITPDEIRDITNRTYTALSDALK